MSFVKHIFNKESPGQIEVGDIQRLLDNEIEESLNLDYEEIPLDVKYDGLAEHVSGFLNTSGGLVIFGVSETKKKGRNVPHDFTWTTIKKEALENNLYQRIDPWYEDIQIHPIQNPSDNTKRIFVIYVPKSKNPPHMANYRYYIRLNFQTKPLGHEQVSAIFKQNYLMKYELINNVYGPIYNELTSYYNTKRIITWLPKLEEIMSNSRFLLSQDENLAIKLDDFCGRVGKWNKAVNLAHFRLASIINKHATDFFNKQLYHCRDHSAIWLNIQAESTHQCVHIDQAVLNDKQPIDFWKEDYPFANIIEAKIELQVQDLRGEKDYITVSVPDKDFRKFMRILKKEVERDDLIQYIRREFREMQSLIEDFFKELKSRM